MTLFVLSQELLEDGLLEHFHKRLVELNMDSAEELQSYINKLQLAVEQGRQKLLEGKPEVSLKKKMICVFNWMISFSSHG